jgi:hypothetical protein
MPEPDKIESSSTAAPSAGAAVEPEKTEVKPPAAAPPAGAVPWVPLIVLLVTILGVFVTIVIAFTNLINRNIDAVGADANAALTSVEILKSAERKHRQTINSLKGGALRDFYETCAERGATPDRNQKSCVFKNGDSERFDFEALTDPFAPAPAKP